jgi:hypothetical protein
MHAATPGGLGAAPEPHTAHVPGAPRSWQSHFRVHSQSLSALLPAPAPAGAAPRAPRPRRVPALRRRSRPADALSRSHSLRRKMTPAAPQQLQLSAFLLAAAYEASAAACARGALRCAGCALLQACASVPARAGRASARRLAQCMQRCQGLPPVSWQLSALSGGREAARPPCERTLRHARRTRMPARAAQERSAGGGRGRPSLSTQVPACFPCQPPAPLRHLRSRHDSRPRHMPVCVQAACGSGRGAAPQHSPTPPPAHARAAERRGGRMARRRRVRGLRRRGTARAEALAARLRRRRRSAMRCARRRHRRRRPAAAAQARRI